MKGKSSVYLLILTLNILMACSSTSTINKTDEGPKIQVINDDFTYQPYIKTIQIYREPSELNLPVIALNTQDQIKLKFDDLEGGFKTYSYKIYHCDSRWNKSQLIENQYLDGFIAQNQIYDYNQSMVTKVPYTSYSVNFPNNDLKIKLSGNYMVVVYLNFDETKPVFSRRFWVFETETDIMSLIHRSMNSDKIQTDVSLNLEVVYRNLQVFNPLNDIQLMVLQNRNTLQKSTLIKPNMLKDKTLAFQFLDELNFQNLNEFRQFDTRAYGYNSLNIQTSYQDSIKHFILRQDGDRSRENYNLYPDINGRFAIANRDGLNASADADYVGIEFRFKANSVPENAHVYVFGQLTDWKIQKEFRMQFNEKTELFELNKRLKQGYYNYYYVLLKDGQSLPDFSYFEGSFQQAENMYQVFVYFRPVNAIYDRLVGFKEFSSLR